MKRSGMVRERARTEHRRRPARRGAERPRLVIRSSGLFPGERAWTTASRPFPFLSETVRDPFYARSSATRFLLFRPGNRTQSHSLRDPNSKGLRGSLAYVSPSSFLFRNSVPAVAGHGGPAFRRPLLRITYGGSRSWRPSEARASPDNTSCFALTNL